MFEITLEFFGEIFNSISSIDLIYILITILSLIKCYSKGFVLSILSMSKWLLAYIITLIIFPRLKPYVKNVIDNEWMVIKEEQILATILSALMIFSLNVLKKYDA